jgi:hypothetical protein
MAWRSAVRLAVNIPWKSDTIPENMDAKCNYPIIFLSMKLIIFATKTARTIPVIE